MKKLETTHLTSGFELLAMCPRTDPHVTLAAYNLALIDFGEDPEVPRAKELPSIHKSIAIVLWFLVWAPFALLLAKTICLLKRTGIKWPRRLRRAR